MKVIKNIGLYFRTIKHLKFKQIYFRIYRFCYSPKLFSKGNLDRSNFIFPPYITFISNNDLLKNKFTFLNSRINLSLPDDWKNKAIPLLWLYNLHYFNDLLASNISIDKKKYHIDKWIEDNPSSLKGPGWDPYTLSLRIVNWIKFFSNENLNSKNHITSLIEQARVLNKSVEFHLMANHVLENAKALIFAGIFFKGQEAQHWLERGIKILETELKEQILEDGAHFELSPMYHSIMLDLVMDLYELSIISNHTRYARLRNIQPFLKKTIAKMSYWLKNMMHPDGEISYFNDAAIGIAQSPKYYLSRANKLLPNTKVSNISDVIHHSDSGYIKVLKKDFFLILNCSEISPSYQPGHAHADSLSMELSYLNQRIFVNLGTSVYEASQRRDYERGTRSHSTLEVNGKNSSEIWSSFRVGRRAKIMQTKISEKDDYTEIMCEHNGYRFIERNLKHTRVIKISESSVHIIDKLNSQKHKGISRFHLHPDMSIECDYENKSGTLILPNARKIYWKAECKKIVLEETKYASDFGRLNNTQTLALHDNNFNSSSLTLKI
jgi:uncharacterized heparinase superfamily protein